MDIGRFCLDTSAYSRFRRGEEEVIRLLDSARWVGVPSIVLGELRTGFSLGSRAEKNQADLARFLSSPVVEVVEIGREASYHYADIVVDLRRAGSPVPTNDIWIAAASCAAGAVVLTYDEHFRSITRVGSVVLGSPT